MSGGLSAALIPRLRALPGSEAIGLFRSACVGALCLFGLFALIFAVFPDIVFRVLAPGLSLKSDIINHYALILLSVSIPLTALSGITSAFLNSDERFFVAGLGTLIFNLAIIVALVASRGNGGLFLLCAAIAAGSAIRLASQTFALPSRVWGPASPVGKPDRSFRNAFVAGIAASSLALLPPVIIRAAASLLGSGSIATINYAQKLVELPLGILITTISTVALSRLSGQFGAGDRDGAMRTLVDNLRLSLFLAIVVVGVGEALAEPAVSVIFMRGAINGEDAARIAALLRITLVGVPFIAVSSLAAAALNAQLRTTEVLRMTLASIGVLAVLALPGLLLSSDTLLMAAMVGSQAALAWFLARRARICLWGAGGVIDRQYLLSIGSGLIVAAPFVGAAIFLGHWNALVAIGLGAAGSALAILAAIRVARHRRISSNDEGEQSDVWARRIF